MQKRHKSRMLGSEAEGQAVLSLTFLLIQLRLQDLGHVRSPLVVGFSTLANGVHHGVQVIQCEPIAVGGRGGARDVVKIKMNSYHMHKQCSPGSHYSRTTAELQNPGPERLVPPSVDAGF